MSPFRDLPTLSGCGRCECGAPLVLHWGEYDCYASGTYDCNIVWRRQISPRTPAPFPEWAQGGRWAQSRREEITAIRRAYWRNLKKEAKP